MNKHVFSSDLYLVELKGCMNNQVIRWTCSFETL